MDAIPQSGSSQAQSLSALISVPGNTAGQDGDAFGNELAKQFNDTGPAPENRIHKPEKTKKGEDELSPGQHPENELLFVISPVVPVFNPVQGNAIVVPPIGVESAAGVPGDAAGPVATVSTQDTVGGANGGAMNDVLADSGLKAGFVTRESPSEVLDRERTTRSIEPMQTADPDKAQEVHAARSDHRRSLTTLENADTTAAGGLLTTAAEERDSETAEKISKKDLLPQTSGKVHEKNEAPLKTEHRRSQSVDVQAPIPADRAEQPLSLDAVAQLTESVPIMTESDALNAAAEDTKAEGVVGSGLLQQKEAVESLPPKQNDSKSASPVEDPKGAKDHKDPRDEGKRVESRNGGAPLHGTAEQGHQQVDQATGKFNTDRAPDVLPGTHPAVNAPKASPSTEHSFVGQPQQAARMNSPEFAAPVTTPADVVHAVRMFERDGHAEMHIGVRSETLGTIDVKTTLHDGSVGVSIGVERHEVRSALVSELPGLENTLREHDLRLGEVRFHDTGSTLASEYGSRQQRQAQDFPRPPASAFYRAAKSGSGSEMPVEMVTTIARQGISVHV